MDDLRDGTQPRKAGTQATRWGARACVVAALLASLILILPPLLPAVESHLGEVERTEARSVAKLGDGSGFIFVSVFDATRGAQILGGHVEYTDGFYEGLYVVEIHQGGAFVKFFYGIRCGEPVTVTFHIQYLTPDGVSGEYVKLADYYC